MSTADASSVIREIERTGTTVLSDGRTVPVHSNIGPECARVIRRAVETARPALACAALMNCWLG